MRNISCGCSSGIAEIFSSVTVAAGKRFPKSTTIATKTVLGNLIMCNLPPDSQQALAIFEDDLLSRLLGRSPWFSCVPTVITNSRPLQVTLAQFQSIFERSYLAVVCDSVEPPPVIVIVHGSPSCPMQALNCHGGLRLDLATGDGKNAFSAAKIGKRLRKLIKLMQKKKRYWTDSSVRAKRWRAKQGKAALTISTRAW